ncbi:MAG: site-specific integrase [Melioribacteraceae bacterium]|nr:site-specific integrase [Melioribacteraceae bacterium]
MYLTKSKKSPYYQIIFERDGKRTTKSTKTKIKSEALKFLSNFEKKINEKKKIETVSLKDFREHYLNYLSGTHSQNYQRAVRTSFRELLKFCGNIDLNKISIVSIDTFISKVYERAPQSSLTYYRILKAAFNKALNWDLIESNPLMKIRAPKIKRNLPIFISQTELNIILDFVSEDYLKNLYLFAFHTGLRAGEIVNLKWSSVSLKKRIITLHQSNSYTTKSKKERVIPINSKLYNILYSIFPIEKEINSILGNAENLKLPDYVFCRIKGVKLGTDFISKKFKKAIRKAGMNDKIHLHTLRHSFASNLVQRGVSLYTIKELLGHSDYRTSQIYSHLQHNNLFEAVELLSESDSKNNGFKLP